MRRLALLRHAVSLLALAFAPEIAWSRAATDAEWIDVKIEEYRLATQQVIRDAPSGVWKVTSETSERLPKVSATWSRAASRASLRQERADFPAEMQQGLAAGSWQELTLDIGGGGFIRAAMTESRFVARLSLESRWDALGLVDQSLAYLAVDPAVPWQVMYRDNVQARRRQIDAATVEWEAVSQGATGPREEFKLTTREVDGKSRAVSFEYFIRSPGDDWRERRNWSRRRAEVGSWKDGLPSSVVTVLEGEWPDDPKPFKESRRIDVLSFAAMEPDELGAALAEKTKLQIGEKLRIESKGIRIEHGSAVFFLGQTKFMARSPILEIPADIAALVANSEMVGGDELRTAPEKTK